MNSRQLNLLKVILISDDYITIKELATSLGVSNRTIHYDLDEIDEYLQQHHLKLIRKRGVGVKVEGEPTTKNHLLLKTRESEDESFSISSERLNEIVAMILEEELTVTYQELSDNFFVSTTSIKNDLVQLKKILNSKECVEIVSNNEGSYIVGDEIQIQKSICTYDSWLFENTYVESQTIKSYLGFLDTRYDSDVVDICSSAILALRGQIKTTIADYYIRNLINVLVVMTTRIKKGKHVSKGIDYTYKEVTYLKTYLISKEMLDEISSVLKIQYTDDDIQYFNNHLISSGIEVDLFYHEDSNELTQKIDSLIERVSEMIHFDLSHDIKLKESLIAHIGPMIFRLQKGLVISNPMLSTIEEEYTIMFSILYLALNDMNDEDLSYLPKDEIAFILVHFLAALERNQQIKRVLVVCPNGIASSQLIINKIKRFLPPLDIIEVSSSEKVDAVSSRDIDFIISTVPIEVQDVPVINVSPLITDKEILKINEFYSRLFVEKHVSDNIYFEALKKYVDLDTVFANKAFKTKEEILEFLSKKAAEIGVAKSGFNSSLLDRERLAPTSSANGVAIPHANPKYIGKTKVFILTNNNFVEWGGRKVNTVIMVCFTTDELTKARVVLKDVYKLVNNKEILQKINLMSSKEIFNFIKEGKIDK